MAVRMPIFIILFGNIKGDVMVIGLTMENGKLFDFPYPILPSKGKNLLPV